MVPNSSEAATQEIIKHLRYQSKLLKDQIDLLQEQANSPTVHITRQMMLGALLAAFLGGLGVVNYLITGTSMGIELFWCVTGIKECTGMSLVADAVEMMAVTRFILAFGIGWPILTLMLGLVSFFQTKQQ